MAIRQMGTKWQVDVTVGGQRSPRINCDTKAEAQRLEAEFRSKMLAGVSVDMLAPKAIAHPTSADSLYAVMTATIKTRWAGTKGESTAVHNAGVWADVWGLDFDFSKITRNMIDDVVDSWAAAGAKAGTINRKLSALSTMMMIAVDKEVIPKKIKMPWRKEYVGRLRYYTDDEVDSLLAHVSYSPPMRRFFQVAIDTGLRLSELSRLIKRDVNLKTGKLDLADTKNDIPTSIPLTAAAKAALKEQMEGLRDHDVLFPDHLNARNISRVIAAWKLERGLPKTDTACFHTLRHTACSRLVQRGVPILVVKAFMRHETIETTMRYAHLAPDSLDQAREALERNAA